MGWQNASTVCAAEGRRDGPQRGFTAREIERLAALIGVSSWAAHDAVRELRRPPDGRVRLPGMRSRARRSPLAAIMIEDGPAIPREAA